MTTPTPAPPRVRPAFLPPTDTAERAGQLVLRDGSRLDLHELGEGAALDTFFGHLDATDRADSARSLGLGAETNADAEELTEAADAVYLAGERARPVGFGAYRLLDEHSAAVTLAVVPELRQRGLATLLLERLMVRAAHHGVERMVGVARRDNASLVELFRRGGFTVEEELEVESPERGALVRLVFRTRSFEGTADEIGLRARAAASLHSLFFPRSVAVVGASRDRESVGYRILDALVRAGFDGPVFPIHPSAGHVGSIRAYPTVAAVGAPIDLAVLAVPARIVQQVTEECIAAGVRSLIVVTAGFAEVGADGRAAQDRLADTVRAAGVRMVGPNCLGLLHTDPSVRLNASFAPIMPPFGQVALCSQSGALGIAIIALARRLGLGLSSFVSVGNKADVSANDLLEYWEDDSATRVILFYLESFGNPRRFASIARRVGRSKPVIAVKAGRTAAGGRAASSHTAALTSADVAVDALFRQTGILRADTLEEMFSLARALVSQPLPPGRRTAIVTNAGGPGILCADALEAAGLAVDPLAPATQDALRTFLPAAASASNPVDMIASASPESYRRAVETVLRADEVDALVVIYTPTGMHPLSEITDAVAEAVEAARRAASPDAAPKPVLASIVGDERDVDRFEVTTASGETIPVYAFPEEIGRSLAKIATYAEWRRADPGVYPEPAGQDLEHARALCTDALTRDGAGWLGAEDAFAVLAAAGIACAPGGVARTADEAVALADEVGYPVVVKLASRVLVHKTDHGGVVLDLEDAAAVRAAFDGIARRLDEAGQREAMDGVLVQPMLAGGVEVMIGVDLDPDFGPLVAFGLGGIHVEILRDVELRVAPLSDRDAREMVHSIRGYRLLEGYRGHPAADVAALEDALLRISRLAEAVPEISELDLNPLFALEPGDGLRAVDARIHVAPPATR
ncbi:MAG: GNAT family N-acetyltransferase [Acidobacteriota bacterium]